MVSHSINVDEKNDQTNKIKLGGFPPILFYGQEKKKINEFAKMNNNEKNLSNINKLNILNIKNILGV